MKNSNLLAVVFFLFLVLSGCKQHQDARRPISQSSGSFMKKSILRNKKLVATEESQIQNVIKNNPSVVYLASNKGYWYSYEVRNTIDNLTPKKGDVALFDYEIKDLKGTLIYSQEELKPQVYYVDKQNIMMGLRDGIKLMHRNEKVNFLFPSNMAYGYHGDDKKINTNQPIICTVTLRDFKTEVAYKKEVLQTIAPTTDVIAKKASTPVTKEKDTITP
ncbi:gliding motility-associated peptidyl-prolyl isomerase GldI [Flavobacterium sp. CHNK8]|uniref:gliding motility-associated peptidyl-prolyl isomerase GldI n=1 Tax=Flavobacterium sp. CHNK8 TaxID=2871165 RepID=UPI001C8D7BBE|nr:gliding motility-associated peptidyl-prolyl isomerase GldI [Flavobacterium sp. CHNK8]QZK90860.1 gliding motility-associated peptidyl-prolyl isomerase GldI [Flavobacterium sp. CHNK8]